MIAAEVVEVNELVCDGRIKASLLITAPSGKHHIVEVFEDELAHFQTATGEIKMRQRGRLANEIAKEHGFNGYSSLSFRELENAVDERQVFDVLSGQISSTP